MSRTIHKLTTQAGSTIFPATVTDAVVHPETGATVTSMMNEYNVSVLFPNSGINDGPTYTLSGAVSVLNSRLTAEEKVIGTRISFKTANDPTTYVIYTFAGPNFNNVSYWKKDGLKTDTKPTSGSENWLNSGNIYNSLYGPQTLTTGEKNQVLSNLGLSETIESDIPTIGYYECSTADNVAAKEITLSGFNSFSLGANIRLLIKFTNTNTVNSCTLKVTDASGHTSGNKSLYYNGQRANATNFWWAGEIVDVYYDGTKFLANSIAPEKEYDVSANNTHEVTTVTVTTRVAVAEGEVTDNFDSLTDLISDTTTTESTRTETSTGTASDNTVDTPPVAVYDSVSDTTTITWVSTRTLVEVGTNQFSLSEAINRVPTSLRYIHGVKVLFITYTSGKYVKYSYTGTEYTSAKFSNTGNWERETFPVSEDGDIFDLLAEIREFLEQIGDISGLLEILNERTPELSATYTNNSVSLKISTESQGEVTSITIPAATSSTAGIMSAADKDKLDNFSAIDSITNEPTPEAVTIKISDGDSSEWTTTIATPKKGDLVANYDGTATITLQKDGRTWEVVNFSELETTFGRDIASNLGAAIISTIPSIATGTRIYAAKYIQKSSLSSSQKAFLLYTIEDALSNKGKNINVGSSSINDYTVLNLKPNTLSSVAKNDIKSYLFIVLDMTLSVGGESIEIYTGTRTDEAGVMTYDDKVKLTNMGRAVSEIMSGYQVEPAASPSIVFKGETQFKDVILNIKYPAVFDVTSAYYNSASNSMLISDMGQQSDGKYLIRCSTTSTTEITSNVTYHFTAIIAESVEISKEVTLKAVDKIYYGFGEDVTEITTYASARANYPGTYIDTSTQDGQYFYFLIPTSMATNAPTLTAVSGGAPVALTLVTNETKQGYHIYRIGGNEGQPYNSGTYAKITIS